MNGVAVEVEVRVSSLLPRVELVGLPETAVRESAARVRAAIAAVGRSFPERRVTVNLAPASLPKSGAGLDLPIGLAILAASGQLPERALIETGFVGELALDGRLRPVRGALALVLAARDAGARRAIVPVENAAEASMARKLEVFGAPDFGSVLAHLLGDESLSRARPLAVAASADGAPCLSEVRGQETTKRALEVAAAGGHALLLCGPPGAGKTMLARRLPGLLPPLNFEEAAEATRIHGAASLLGESPGILTGRPFRAPHHSASPAGLLGGGSPPRPGEISLAHRGILFLDELPEFDRRSLEGLRQVLEDRRINIVRSSLCCVFPAHFQLVAACNPCPCGWYRSGRRDCRCDDAALERYRRRISGPLLDRIDLHLRVPPLRWREIDGGSSDSGGETSREVRERVVAARQLQIERGGVCNAELSDRVLDELCAATPDARTLLGRAVDKTGLSARVARRLLRVARTVADLRRDDRVGPAAIAEALGYREKIGAAH